MHTAWTKIQSKQWPGKEQIRLHQGKSLNEPAEGESPHLLHKQGEGVHQPGAHRCHYKGKLHRWCLKEASEGSLPHKMHDLLLSAESQVHKFLGKKSIHLIPPSPLHSLAHPCWLFPVPPAEEGPGVTWLCPWMNLRWIGRGHQDADQRWLRQGFPEVATRL